MGLPGAFFVALLASLSVAVLLVLTRRLHGHLTLDSHAGVQKLHTSPVPRIGGVALFIGLICGAVSLIIDGVDGAGRLAWQLLLTSIPAFAAGLAEDITKRVGVKQRLIATLVSGLLFCFATGESISSVHIPGVDFLLSYWLPSILLTTFAIGGIANAVNLIDGVNGLASGSAIIILVGFALIAWQEGDMALVSMSLICAGAMAGFAMLNFPAGMIFLGDAGAYLAGFLLAVLAVLLPARNPELSPLIGLLALSYPVIETLISIHRRMVRVGTHPGQPDRLHLHSLVFRSLARRAAAALGHPGLRNPMTGAMLWVFPLLSTVMAVLFGESTALVIFGLAVMLLVYLALYRRVALLRQSASRQRISP